MLKILKLILIVALATLVGIWASKYHGYVMLVVADKVIRMNLVAFVFVLLALLFLSVFGYRLIKLVFNLPQIMLSWFVGLFTVSKQERFVDLVADISLEQNVLLGRMSVAKIIKLTPVTLREYILFRKLAMIVRQKDIKSLELALKNVDSELCTHKFFAIYKLYLEKNFFEAEVRVKRLLTDKNTRLKSNVVNLAAKIALANNDGAFALELLEKYDRCLKLSNEEKLIVLALKESKTSDQARAIFDKSDETAYLTRVYAEKLMEFEEDVLAQKLIREHISESNVEPKMLSIYVNAFNESTAKLYPKVCSEKNSDIDSILTLLDLAMMKSDNPTFKMTHDYIETKLKGKLSSLQSERYNHILCKFYIKNGNVPGMDLSESRLVYENY
ncbi:heme biosynthesis protein HemY [Francisellaceae bacterium CB300]